MEQTTQLQSSLHASSFLVEKDEDEPPSCSTQEIPEAEHLRLCTPRVPATICQIPTVDSSDSASIRKAFRKRFYPTVTNRDWNDWHWQIKNRIRTHEQLQRFLKLSTEEHSAFTTLNTKIPLSITPYYLSLLSEDQPNQPLRRTVVPTVHELFRLPGEEDDPLNEEGQSQLPGLVHRYPDRVLLLAIDFCATYCRYCTRSRMVGRGAIQPGGSRIAKAIEYIRNTPTIRDVLISGGDPLTLSDNRLEWILKQVRDIPHVEIIRIGTKAPAVLPQRITPQLVRMLRKYHPIWMSIHYTHPDECTPEAYRAAQMLADAGIPLGSQTVLLKDVNDNVETMKSLVHNLLKMRVRPYYLYQCDLVSGTSHFRTSVEKGMEIIRGLRGHTSGYGVPNYVVDTPGGGGKIPVMPNYVVSQYENELILSNYKNQIFHYSNPGSQVGRCSSIGELLDGN